MTQPQPDWTKLKLISSQTYFSRELSWLAFNQRVLHEAFDERTPLLERVKFLAIFSSNLDEYFMVRVAGIKQQIQANVTKITPDGRPPTEQLQVISEMLRPMFEKQQTFFQTILLPALKAEGIHLLDYASLNAKQKKYLHTHFEEQIFPVLTPLAVDPAHPFPYISNLSLNLAVVVQEQEPLQEDADLAEAQFARVKVPKVLPRFVLLPKELYPTAKDKPCLWAAIPIEQVITHNIEALFPGMNVKACYAFRITRNADLAVEEDEADDLLLAIEQELRKRRLGGSTVRLEIETGTSPLVRDTLMSELELIEDDVYDVDGLLGQSDLFALTGIPLGDSFKDPKWSPVTSRAWQLVDLFETEGEGEDAFSLIRHQDRLVHHPYESFSATVQAFITQAAKDPDVLTIKMTLYRTSGDSPIINALISAAENGKQVVALVELKARFDEENNINWARTLENSGVHVVYGLVGLKTHTKVILVVRKEANKIRRYVHIGTGNYNPKTAGLYTDLGLFSCREELGADLSDLFNSLTGYSRQQTYRQLLIAPLGLRDRMVELIEQETEHAKQGRSGRIICKMNALVDPTLIEKLYFASQSGVKIDLIVRGVCCLTPGIPGLSDNIGVISIVGRFLEHSRIYYFQNDSDPQIFIGSADWMPRNLDRRVEAVTPVADPQIRQRLLDILNISLADNRYAWEMQSDGSYIQRRPQNDEPIRSAHVELMEKARKMV
jgi:polyphosphate kinase